MGKDDVYYSYDIDADDFSDEVVAKTRFRDDGKIDRWDGINDSGYSHDVYSSPEEFAKGEKGDVYSRSIGEDPDKEWEDRDGVMNKLL